MSKLSDFDCGCSSDQKLTVKTEGVIILPSMDASKQSTSQSDKLKAYLKPGYDLCPFVEGFVDTDAGPVPRVKTEMDNKDYVSTFIVRSGIGRHDYKVAPGLYCVGNPDKTSEVLVTANFKLTFDHLRRALGEINAWILVLDTRGINVWCAAGKKTFSTGELVNRVKLSDLAKVVDHRRLIVPQLGATGVSARDVKKASGFEVVYGPIRATDIPAYLKNNRKADRAMRYVTFSFIERVILTPVELKLIVKPAFIVSIILIVMSGLGPGFFSFQAAGNRGLASLIFLFAGIFSGVVITPAFLPFIPFKEFAAKGIISGVVFALPAAMIVSPALSGTAAILSLSLLTVATSSALAMNFTGATPFTSPSGVEKEMRRFLPVQLISLATAIVLWIYSAF